jgi:hypothetical protein
MKQRFIIHLNQLKFIVIQVITVQIHLNLILFMMLQNLIYFDIFLIVLKLWCKIYQYHFREQ